MAQGIQEPDHVWLVMMKTMRALTRYAPADIEDTGLGDSDFPVLEVLLHKGPLPVNTIGPIVDLTPGSISIAVDRLVARAWSAGSRARRTGGLGSSPSPRAARTSLFQLSGSMPGR
jgi:hypothetical protein